MFNDLPSAPSSAFEKFVERSSTGIGLFNEQGHWLHKNASLTRLLGHSEDESEPESLFELFQYPSDLLICETLLERLSQSDLEVDQQEACLMRTNGEAIWVSISYSLLSESESSRIYAAQFNDLTNQKQTADYLKRLTQLAAGIAHEVKNPLTAIKGFIQLMIKKGSTDDFLKIIQAEVERMEIMLSEIFVLGKPANLKTKAVNYNAMIKQVIALLQNQAAMKSITLNLINEQPILNEVMGDETRLKQVFINLIKNAIEATVDGGIIAISTELHSEQIVTRITDQGPGIPEKVLEKLGTPFYSTKEGGTGLGLMMSFDIIKEHSGLIEFESSPHGTCVKVTLPVQH
ncbi:ATP-binding protein [Pullulanibacillus sp. KACC 23026]|uniref:sensor histidine kinase n=1 Tax=Pullulanibacillus sp. KACC 23026 TaxID=3028315 RepID=UPI0023AEB78F|nr:sensor histidine kinase [Pullulanibacillus sp. KACC 23026]WEG13599.1 ATP-binding protein [Pullulanibacillus sp. KACC 23026]